MPDVHKPDAPDIDEFFEGELPEEHKEKLREFQEEKSLRQRAMHPNSAIPGNTLVYELFTKAQLEDLCDEIAEIIFFTPKEHQLDLMTGFVNMLSAQLKHEEGPPERWSHAEPGKFVRDYERSKFVYHQIKWNMDEIGYALKQGIYDIKVRLAEVTRSTLQELAGKGHLQNGETEKKIFSVDPSGPILTRLLSIARGVRNRIFSWL